MLCSFNFKYDVPLPLKDSINIILKNFPINSYVYII